MSRYIPAEIANGEKQGFSAHDASWFRGESIDYVRREILNPRARLFEYLDYTSISQLVQEHLDGKHNRRLLIWSLLKVEWWLRKFLG
jgi:asparagine synthase (glutamine-hydrolysing)